ncbi:hypothetical protein Tco_1237880 [Tanacetum coccineum]
MIDKMNKKDAGMDEEEVPKEPKSTKVEVKKEGHEENIKKRSGKRLKMKATKKSKRFDRLDFIKLHSLVMQRFSTTTPEGIDLVLWGDLRIMFEETVDDDVWKNQEKWIIKNIKNWLVQKQTTFGKDFSNPFIADSLLKTICAPCYSNEALAIPEKTTTGKEISNPFMAGSLPKTT